MSNSTVDASKRTWLIASGCAGAVGAGFVAVPFVSSFQPSERAKAAGAPVEVDISALRPGEKMTVEWRGKPVWILRRTPEQVASLPKLDAQLADLNEALETLERDIQALRDGTGGVWTLVARPVPGESVLPMLLPLQLRLLVQAGR